MSKLIFTEIAWDEYQYWQEQDKKTLKKINKLLKEICRTPYEGEGKPELLKYKGNDIWSRRINQYDRLVYIVNEGNIEIIQCKGHYNE